MTENVVVINEAEHSAVGRIVSVIAHYEDFSLRHVIFVYTVGYSCIGIESAFIYHRHADMLVALLLIVNIDLVLVIIYPDLVAADTDDS